MGDYLPDFLILSDSLSGPKFSTSKMDSKGQPKQT